MILDTLDNANRYLNMHKGFKEAFEFLSRPDLNDLPPEKYNVDGEQLFVIIAKEHGRKKDDAQLETHEKYIDIQFILAGSEGMGWKPKSLCKKPATEYDPETDLQFFTDEPDSWATVKPGSYAIFFPEDAHMPLLSSGDIHKAIVKIAVNKES